MPNFNGDVVFIDTSGQVRASDGDLSLRADDTGTRSIIVGSGVALRPDVDAAMDLGTDTLRWYRMYGGFLRATSGILGADPLSDTPYMEFSENLFAVVGGGVGVDTFEFNNLEIAGSACHLNLAAGSALTVDGNTNLGNTTANHLTSNFLRPSTDAQDGFETFVGTQELRYKMMHAASGIFNHLAPPTSGTFIVVEDGDLVPIVDARRSIGTLSRRWARMHAASGIFNTLDAPASGTFIQANASLLPEQDAIYSLGTGARQWAHVFAVSGTVPNFSSTTINATNITSVGALAALGSFGVLGLTIFIGPVFLGAVTAPTADATASVGVQGLRLSAIYGVSGFLDTISPVVSGGMTTLNGSLFPDQDQLRSLGGNLRRWGSVHASSGLFTFLSATSLAADIASIGDLDVSSSLVFSNDGVSIITQGNVPWSMSDGDVTFSDGAVNFSVPYDRTGYNTYRPKLNGAPLVTNKEARTTVHAVVTANSGAIINSNAERDIYNYTIPANTLSASGKLVLECIGSFTNMAGANVDLTPRVYVNGSNIWGDVLSVSQGPRAADFALYAEIIALGSLTGQRVRGGVVLGSRTAGSVTGNGDFATTNFGAGNWSSQATSGTVNFGTPINIRVSMQLGTASTNASYSGFHCMLSHQPFPGI